VQPVEDRPELRAPTAHQFRFLRPARQIAVFRTGMAFVMVAKK
jgi:hypothetical protein